MQVVWLYFQRPVNIYRQHVFFPAYSKAGLGFLPFIWKGRKQEKNLYPVKFFEKDSTADLTGVNNPVHPVK